MLERSDVLREFSEKHEDLFRDIMNVFRDFLDALKKVITSLSGKQFGNAREARAIRDYYDELSGIYKNAVAGTFEKINEAANSEMSAKSVDTPSPEMYNDKEQLSRKDKLIGKQFPPENESQSDANKYCTLWAKNPDVKSGDARLASYRDRWYLIEKFDSADFGYQIVERVLKAQLKEYRKDYEDVRNSKRKSVATSADGIDSRIGGRNQYASGNRNVDSDVTGYRRKNSTVRSLGTRQYTGGKPLQSGLYDDRKSGERNKEGRRASGSEEVKKQFSKKSIVEETKDLVAVHNMTADELLKTVQLGGLPMPSIAIIKANSGHSSYGDVCRTC